MESHIVDPKLISLNLSTSSILNFINLNLKKDFKFKKCCQFQFLTLFTFPIIYSSWLECGHPDGQEVHDPENSSELYVPIGHGSHTQPVAFG